MQCPKCERPTLEKREVEGTDVHIDACSKCGGLWFDAGELDLTLGDLAVRGLTVPTGSESSTRRCPRCGKPMSAFEYPQTYARIEMCGKCKGVWLDADEYEEIAVVRDKRRRDGTLDSRPLPGGVKGSLIAMINSAIDALWEG